MEINRVGWLLGFRQGDSDMSIASQGLIRIAIFGYIVFDIWFEHIYILGYNIFLFTGIAGLIILFVEGIMMEEEPKDPNKIDYSEYNKKMDEQPPLP